MQQTEKEQAENSIHQEKWNPCMAQKKEKGSWLQKAFYFQKLQPNTSLSPKFLSCILFY